MEAIKENTIKQKHTARDRISMLLDPESFVEIDALVRHRSINFGMANKDLLGDGVITGYGYINGLLVFIFSQDFSKMGGSIGEMHAQKICKIIDCAIKNNAPLIGLYDSGGARVQEGIDALSACGKIFSRNIFASGKILQISAIMGPCAGAASYSPTLTDFIFMVKDRSFMFLTGPKIIETYLGQRIEQEELGGTKIHCNISGIADLALDSEKECLNKIKELIYLLCNIHIEKKKSSTESNSLDLSIDLTDQKKPYDMHLIIDYLMDDGYFFEIKPQFAMNLLTGFARLNGYTVGIVANQPSVLAGSLTSDSANKAARFIRFCDSFNIPIISLVDVPGFLPGPQQEMQGVLKHGAKMLFAFNEASVPKITVIIRKAYGGAFIAMCSKEIGADHVFALPTAEISVVGPEGAIDIIIGGKEVTTDHKNELLLRYKEKMTSPYFAASRGYIDEIIELQQLRERLIDTLHISSNRRFQTEKKHSLIPL